MTHAPELAPARYSFGDLLIGGAWQSGSAGTIYKDIDPFTGEMLVEVSQADTSDVDAAFAAAAQREWAATAPSARAEVLRRAAAILEARRAEVVDWLICESGSVRMKAELEWGAVRAIIVEAATLPTYAWGRIIPGDIPGKEHRIYREPVGGRDRLVAQASAVMLPILGTSRVKHLDENVAAANVTLTDAEFTELDAVSRV